ncbi:MAG: hypothetical protein V7K38_00600 [Nostoc sp.]|uniref:hypothetical protein n=1 Tax=Nostoc sp. TaxID=1180 RepID=UPI002FF61D2E
MEQMPDSNFYKACVPKLWSQYRPEFFNCGDRKDVLDTYFTLSKLHDENKNNSYLTLEKLFAIVDVDLQTQNITKEYSYSFSDTEAIFCDLYTKLNINEENAKQHRIWVTGLIHKEAYFIMPEIQPIFDTFSTLYNSNSLVLRDIYLTMADAIITDSDLESNLSKVSNRISHCSGLDCTAIDKLRDSWKEQFENAQDDTQKNELILALLALKKAKYYWNQIQPPSDWTSSVQTFKDQLLLEIGRFYSEQSNHTKYHIPCFFKILRQFAE